MNTLQSSIGTKKLDLVFIDDQALIPILTIFLNRIANVTYASDGEAGLDKIKKKLLAGTPPDFVCTDFHMQPKDGKWFIEKYTDLRDQFKGRVQLPKPVLLSMNTFEKDKDTFLFYKPENRLLGLKVASILQKGSIDQGIQKDILFAIFKVLADSDSKREHNELHSESSACYRKLKSEIQNHILDSSTSQQNKNDIQGIARVFIHKHIQNPEMVKCFSMLQSHINKFYFQLLKIDSNSGKELEPIDDFNFKIQNVFSAFVKEVVVEERFNIGSVQKNISLAEYIASKKTRP